VGMSATNAAPDYRRHQFTPALIAHAVWRSFRFARSYRGGKRQNSAHAVVTGLHFPT